MTISFSAVFGLVLRKDAMHYYLGSLPLFLMLHYWGYLGAIFKTLLYTVAIAIGLALGCKTMLFTKRKYELSVREHYNNPLLKQMLLDRVKGQESKSVRTATLVSRNVDNVIKDLIRCVIRDYVEWWYKELVIDQNKMYKNFKSEIWLVLANLKERLKRMDDVKFFTNDIVVKIHQHFQKIKFVTSTPAGECEPFKLSEFLETPESEKDHLRGVSDFVLVLILPSKSAHCQSLRHLLREILTNLVLFPAIEMLCQPDFINQKLLAYLQWHQSKITNEANPYTYAKNFKDFVQIINKTGDVKSLEFMRKCIITEIMHATTINNLKRDKGMDIDKEFNPETHDKGDLLKARNLKVYINQLKFAKNLCEKQIKSLGNGSSGHTSGSTSSESTIIPGKTVLSFSIIMENERFRRYFSEHLHKHEQKTLLGFWEMVQEMKTADKSFKHQLGNEIIQIYVNNPTSIVKLSKPILKGMEGYMMANKGPEAFYLAQEDVYKLMEERFYPTFIVSSMYNTMLERSGKLQLPAQLKHSKDKDLDAEDGPMGDGGGGAGSDYLHNMTLSAHPSLAAGLHKQTSDKLKDKKQALRTFMGAGTDSKMVHMLEKEISELETTVAELDCYIDRTTRWMNYLGHWQAAILNIKMRENERPIDVNICVRHSGATCDDESWQVSRTVRDFHALQQKLLLPAPWLKRLDLPNPNKPRIRIFEQDSYAKKMEEQLQNFLNAILENEELNKSEAVYEFLVTLPEILRISLPQAKKSSKFSFIQFFKSSQGSGQEDSSDDELLFLDEVDSKDDKKDSIAEPLYSLVGDLFDLKGVFSLFRRTLITFVQISFGKTINKQLRETVSWLISEPMLHYYLQMFRDSFWPPKESKDKGQEVQLDRSEDVMEKTRNEAKAELMRHVPEVLNNFVGQQNSRLGMAKIFEALQNSRLNKQLFYDVLEAFIYEFAPELRPNQN